MFIYEKGILFALTIERRYTIACSADKPNALKDKNKIASQATSTCRTVEEAKAEALDFVHSIKRKTRDLSDDKTIIQNVEILRNRGKAIRATSRSLGLDTLLYIVKLQSSAL